MVRAVLWLVGSVCGAVFPFRRALWWLSNSIEVSISLIYVTLSMPLSSVAWATGSPSSGGLTVVRSIVGSTLCALIVPALDAEWIEERYSWTSSEERSPYSLLNKC